MDKTKCTCKGFYMNPNCPVHDHNLWVNSFITIEFIAWDESQANELGRYNSYGEATQAILDYAKTLKCNLDPKEES